MALFKKTKLYEAIQAADLETMKEMVEKGVDPNYEDGYGRSFLYYAIQSGNLDAVRLLIERGGLVDEKAAGRQGTLLHMAARKGALEISDYLLEKNPALLKSKNSDGNTALHTAAEGGFADLVEFLVSKGADPRQKNFENRTPLFLAQQQKHDDAVLVLRRHLGILPSAAQETTAPPPSSPAAPAAVDAGAPSEWKKLPGERIAEVRLESAIGYRITEIFNFSARERTTLYQNLETKMETVETRAFDQVGDKVSLERALEELRRRGGTADAGSINGLDKKKFEIPRPAP